MSQAGNRTKLLALVVVLLGLAVVFRGSLFGGAAEQSVSEEPTLRERYLADVELTERHERLAAESQRWVEAQRVIEDQWTVASRELVRGRTIELAEAGFRERVLAEVKDLKFLESSANAIAQAAAPITPGQVPSPIRPVALRLEVRTDAPEDVYRLIDRLEHLPDMRASVGSVQINGPGLAQVLGEVRATIQINALALVGEEVSR